MIVHDTYTGKLFHVEQTYKQLASRGRHGVCLYPVRIRGQGCDICIATEYPNGKIDIDTSVLYSNAAVCADKANQTARKL